MKFLCFALIVFTLALCYSQVSASPSLGDIIVGGACYEKGASCATIPTACCPGLNCEKDATTQSWTCT